MISWLIFLLVPLIRARCDDEERTRGETCLNPTTTTSTDLTFPALFPDGAKAVYAVEKLSKADSEALNLTGSIDPKYEPFAQLGWWLEYDQVSFTEPAVENPPADDTHDNTVWITTVDAFVLQINSSVGGDTGGCEDLLGQKCIDKLNSTIYDEVAMEGPVTPVLGDAEDLGSECPEDLWKYRTSIQRRNGTLNAAEQDIKCRFKPPHGFGPDRGLILPSGNSSFTYFQDVALYMNYEQLVNNSAVAVLVRRKLVNPTSETTTVAMVCTSLSAGEEDQDGDEDGDKDAAAGNDDDAGTEDDANDDSEDAAVMTRVPIALAVIVAGFVTLGV